jgi:hypothetical protein
MGPTFVMKTGQPRFYTNSTTADAIARLAAVAQLGFVDEWGKQHYVWPQLAQTDESDWEFANDVAAREGAQLLCTDGVLRLIDPQNILTRSAPVMLLSNNQVNSPIPVAGVLEINATSYTERLPQTWSPSVAFLNGSAAETVPGTSGRYSFQNYFSAEQPFRNKTEAQMAQTLLPVNWNHQAQIRVSGSGRLAPGVVVYLRGGNQAATNEPHDGIWYVTDVKHTMTNTQFQSALSTARVTVSIIRGGTASRSWWPDSRGRPTLVLNQLGNWMSTWR